MKKTLFFLLFIGVIGISLSGCQIKNPFDRTTSVQIENTISESDDEITTTPTPTISSSSEVDTLEKELQNTTIETEIFIDL